jgi:NDP-4-keto-2,6-dideoxyhexose 3-C-methyltransferase
LSVHPCFSCGGSLSQLFDLGSQEVINLGTKAPMKAPLVVMKCDACDLVQLRDVVDRDYLFRDYYYRSGATATMREHLKGVVEEAMKRVELRERDVWLDIGSNDGTLLGFVDGWKVGFEPSDVEAPASFMTYRDFFSESAYRECFPTWNAKVITCIASFYSVLDPNKFLQDVKRVLAPDGLFVLQVNYLPDTLRNNAVGDFCHEHLCYYSLTTLDRALVKNGLKTVDWSFNDINGGSIRVFAGHFKGDEEPAVRRWSATIDKEDDLKLSTPEPYLAFYERVMTRAIRVKAFLLDKVFDVVGASTRGATFLQLTGIKGRFTIERDASKVGRTYLGMPIVSEELANDNPPDVKVLMPTWFKSEILEREKVFLDGGGTILVPLPEPKLITKTGTRDV